ncbi:uncharacterized protein L3040_003865 [Drepanopeziza brunnea f. sp. 'multigermtubi']|uniref:uncharacterized protein n=1 Tax=Drepanopeziza brunnea f. sp. 'multigermtubi' TaxID=698441 RepID=UPI00238C89B4|nr:hypothetical protein L3040_003865 [Drepanopeziza brunnea f. sp. 'multigermtubi']
MKLFQTVFGLLLLVELSSAGPLRRELGRRRMARSFAFSNTSIPIRISTASVAGTSDTRTIIPVITSSDLSSLSSSVEYPSSTSIMLASLTDQTTDSHLSIPSSSSQFSPSSTAAKSSFASSRSIALVTSTSPPASLLSRPPSASPGNSTRLSTRPALSSSLPSSSAVERQSPSILSSPSPSASALKASAHRAAASFSLRITTGAASDLILMTVSPTRSVPSLRTQSAAATPSGQQDSSTSLPPTSSSIRTSIPASATLLPSPFTAVNPAPGSLTFSATSSTYSIPRFTLNNTRSIALPSFSTSRGLESGPATTILITIDLSSITASKPSTTPSTALSSSPSFVFVWTRSSLPASTISHIPTVIATPPAPTSTISAATFAANLAQAQGYNVLFSTLNFSSPCTDRQIACIGGSVGTCNNEGSFQITDHEWGAGWVCGCGRGQECIGLELEPEQLEFGRDEVGNGAGVDQLFRFSVQRARVNGSSITDSHIKNARHMLHGGNDGRSTSTNPIICQPDDASPRSANYIPKIRFADDTPSWPAYTADIEVASYLRVGSFDLYISVRTRA